MLLIFVGPLISQSMPMEHHTGMTMPMSASMDMDMDMDMPSHSAAHGSEHGAQPRAPVAGADDGADHALWAKCGYCTLLFSCPALIQSVAIIALAAARPADLFNAVTQPGYARSNIFPNARSRAPPLFATR
ncbi:hypothetical protein IV01_22790 [Pseudomonas syringae]|uniref:DUF2946 domain-containing protein n=2 Tax=Pseudomonas syringae TaxID=317 RepID=A0A085V941_PSESX|nr:hypothetical protein IV01_22790 [Pseudomonas syringae]